MKTFVLAYLYSKYKVVLFFISVNIHIKHFETQWFLAHLLESALVTSIKCV